jgi:hypothetical protein
MRKVADLDSREPKVVAGQKAMCWKFSVPSPGKSR